MQEVAVAAAPVSASLLARSVELAKTHPVTGVALISAATVAVACGGLLAFMNKRKGPPVDFVVKVRQEWTIHQQNLQQGLAAQAS